MALAIGSVSLFADSVDFLEDAAVNLLILAALGWTDHARSRLGSLLAMTLLAPALATVWTAWEKFQQPAAPSAVSLTATAAGALAVNFFCAFLLAGFRHHVGSLTRAAFLSARNDAVANIAIIAAGLVIAFLWHSAWPDLLVGLGVAAMNADAAREVGRRRETNVVATCNECPVVARERQLQQTQANAAFGIHAHTEHVLRIEALCTTSLFEGAGKCAAAERWHVELHQFRIEANVRMRGRPTPEGMYRNGVDWVMVLLVDRQNAAEGVTEIRVVDRPGGASAWRCPATPSCSTTTGCCTARPDQADRADRTGLSGRLRRDMDGKTSGLNSPLPMGGAHTFIWHPGHRDMLAGTTGPAACGVESTNQPGTLPFDCISLRAGSRHRSMSACAAHLVPSATGQD